MESFAAAPPALQAVYTRVQAEFAHVPGVVQEPTAPEVANQVAKEPIEPQTWPSSDPHKTPDSASSSPLRPQQSKDTADFADSDNFDDEGDMQVDHRDYDRSIAYPEPGDEPGSPQLSDMGVDSSDEW